MPTRPDIVRHILADWIGGLQEHGTADFAIEGDGGIRLGIIKRMVYPDLTVTVDELVELDEDRIFTRLTVRSRDRPDAVRWPAVAVFRFRGDQVATVWSVTDHLPWLTAVGAVDAKEIERRLDGPAADHGNDASPGS